MENLNYREQEDSTFTLYTGIPPAGMQEPYDACLAAIAKRNAQEAGGRQIRAGVRMGKTMSGRRTSRSPGSGSD
jgi:hypothetical protein